MNKPSIPKIEERLKSQSDSRWLVPSAIFASVVGMILLLAFTLIDAGDKSQSNSASDPNDTASSRAEKSDESQAVSATKSAPASKSAASNATTTVDLIPKLGPLGERYSWSVSESGSLTAHNDNRFSYVTTDYPLRDVYQLSLRFAVGADSDPKNDLFFELPVGDECIPFIISSEEGSATFSFAPSDGMDEFGSPPFGLRLTNRQLLGRMRELLFDVKPNSITVSVNRSQRFTLDLTTAKIERLARKKIRLAKSGNEVEFFRVELTQ